MEPTGLLAPAKDRSSSKASELRIERGLLALGCALTLALNPVVLIAAEAAQPTPAAPSATTTAPPAGAPAATGAPAAAAPTGSTPPGASGASGAAGASGTAAAKPEVKLTNDQLDSLVAPVALYPDDLLAQTLVASTYPLEIIQLSQWMVKNKDLKDKALADAVAKQPWDPSIQSMAAVPEVVKRLSDDIQWTTDLGNAFLAQQTDVMDACQRMRKKAKDKGALESNEQQKVETKVIEEKTVIVVESANPEVVYVPSYSPSYVYGPPAYPYPPIYYPYYAPGAAFVSFSFGVAMGAAFWGGSCCGCGWGGGDVDINVDNNFNRNTNVNTGDIGSGNRGDRGGAGGNRGGAGASNKAGGGKWSHNPSHRGAAPYGDKGTANKYGGQARGDAPRASQQGGRGTGSGAGGGRGGSPSAGTSNVGGGGGRGGSPSAGTRDAGGGSRGSGSSASNRSGSSSRGSSGGGFSGSSRGYSGSSARSAGSRGSSSFGGGGGRGGGGRGGGGRR